MLDSDTASYIIKGKSPNIEAKLCTLMPADVCISAVLDTTISGIINELKRRLF
jgi:hypothetical protein